MIKIFLVEDEFVVREGIKNKINWSSHGYEFCGEAGDGEIAFPLIQKLRPDIVITDIKMPFMDGLTLSALIKKEMPWVEIIVLSGYEEFEYAKEGIKIGVAEYLTKPISGEELLKAVDRVAANIATQREEQLVIEKYQKEMEENILHERKNLFQYMVAGSKNIKELLDLADKLNIDISAIYYNVILLYIAPTNRTAEEYSTRMVDIEEKLRDMKLDKVIYFDRSVNGKALLLKADSIEELEALQNDTITRIEEIVKPYHHIRYFGGIGEPVNRLRELPDSFESASRALAYRHLTAENLIIKGKLAGKVNDFSNDTFNFSEIDLKNIDREKIKGFLKCGQQEEVTYFVDEYFESFDDDVIKSKLFRQYIILDVYFCVLEFLDTIQKGRNEIETIDSDFEVLSTIEKSIAYIKRIVNRAIELRAEVAGDKYGSIVEAAIKYINENYSNDELSLNSLAEHVNFSPNYLSMIFSQETGQTFIKYLTDFRMNKAKELLRCTGKRSGEISLEIGYKDPHYFSYLFKKTQGVTPSKYRGNSDQGDDNE